jgi:hypothetical protein
MGPLLKEMRTSMVAAVINGVLGVGGILGAGILLVLRLARGVRSAAPGRATSEGSLLIYVFLGGIFLLGGAGFLLFALLQMTTRLRVFRKGMVWRRYGNKRVVLWLEVEHFGRGDAAAATLTSWSMLLRGGERIDFHSGLYNRREFAETMELIAEQIEESHKQFR